jgi:hypothetical protein
MRDYVIGRFLQMLLVIGIHVDDRLRDHPDDPG